MNIFNYPLAPAPFPTGHNPEEAKPSGFSESALIGPEKTFSMRMFEYKTTRSFIKFKIIDYVLNGLHSIPLFKFIK